MADIEEKLDILIKAYMQDRERFLALPVPDSNSHSIINKHPPNPPAPPCGGILMTSSAMVSTPHAHEIKCRNLIK